MCCGRYTSHLGQVGGCGIALATPDSLLKQKSRCLGCRDSSPVFPFDEEVDGSKWASKLLPLGCSLPERSIKHELRHLVLGGRIVLESVR